MIKYLGSKRRILPAILGAIEGLVPPDGPGGATVLDLFSGTARVGQGLRARGYRVIANDSARFAVVLARCYVCADGPDLAERAAAALADLRTAPPRAGWFTQRYAVEARYFHPDNAARIEGARERIAARGYDADLEAVLLTALMEAADRVDSTVGVQMAYLKSWAPRALRPFELRMPQLGAGAGIALEGDALDAARTQVADVAYLDPPYNQHSYLGNYHVWETLVRWDDPQVYGVARKRADVRERKSRFNSRTAAAAALGELIDAVRAPHLVVSFSDEGFLDRETVAALLEPRGTVAIAALAQPRYVGARIGIHSPQGVPVGRVGRLANTEYLFVVRGRGVTQKASQKASQKAPRAAPGTASSAAPAATPSD